MGPEKPVKSSLQQLGSLKTARREATYRNPRGRGLKQVVYGRIGIKTRRRKQAQTSAMRELLTARGAAMLKPKE